VNPLYQHTSLEAYHGKVITTRNTMICSENSFFMNVTKELYRNVEIEQGCGCSGSAPIVISNSLMEEWSTEKQVLRQHKYFGWEVDTRVDSNMRLHTEVSYYNNLSKNEVYTFIDYNLDKELVNGSLDYLLEEDILEEQLVNFRGITIDSRTQIITDFNNYYPTAWEIELPEEGDYLIYTKLTSKSCGKTLRAVEYVTKIPALRYVKFHKLPCGVSIDNLAFENIDVKVSVLKEKKGVYTFEEIETIALTHLTSKDYYEGFDGVYKFEVSRASINSNDEIDTYIHINFCNVQKCLQSITEELLCKDMCKEKDLSLFDIITTLFNTLMLKIHDEYLVNTNEKEYYKVLENEKLKQLYTIHQLIDRINRYCYDCKGLQISDCNCK
jgi:hypothetical protein